MAELRLETFEHRTAFEPGETLYGLAGWQLDQAPAEVYVRLTWYTEGKGDQDVGVAVEKMFENPPAVDARNFEMTLPDHPYSFSGHLISIRWALELIIDKRASKRLDIIIAPGAEELRPASFAGEGDGQPAQSSHPFADWLNRS